MRTHGCLDNKHLPLPLLYLLIHSSNYGRILVSLLYLVGRIFIVMKHMIQQALVWHNSCPLCLFVFVYVFLLLFIVFFYHSFILQHLESRTRLMLTPYDGRCWWDMNLCTPACESPALPLWYGRRALCG